MQNLNAPGPGFCSKAPRQDSKIQSTAPLCSLAVERLALGGLGAGMTMRIVSLGNRELNMPISQSTHKLAKPHGHSARATTTAADFPDSKTWEEYSSTILGIRSIVVVARDKDIADIIWSQLPLGDNSLNDD
jgi:hypothetical protein